MTSVFDGLASVLNDVFGAEVTHIDSAWQSRSVRGVFREQPIEVAGEDGRSVLIEAPTLSVPAGRSFIAVGDRIRTGDGRTFQIVNRIGTGSPAADAMTVMELRAVSA